MPVIAKLEKPQALKRLEEIFEASDGVMVARGDLGVEMPAEKVPVIQKYVIRRAADWRKPVIIATQMLESMIENPRPTRAEASDVANAVFDGTDAVMLSAETATGLYPRETVAMMARIVVEAESNMAEFTQPRRRQQRRLSIAEAICESIAHAAEDLHMGAIAVFTETGNTALLISKYRPLAEIYAFCRTLPVCNRLNLLWGVQPVVRDQALTAEEMLSGGGAGIAAPGPGQDRRRAGSGGGNADGVRVNQLHAPAPGDGGRRARNFALQAAAQEDREEAGLAPGPFRRVVDSEERCSSSNRFFEKTRVLRAQLAVAEFAVLSWFCMTADVQAFGDASLNPPVRGFLHRPEQGSGDGLVLAHGAGSNSNSPLLISSGRSIRRRWIDCAALRSSVSAEPALRSAAAGGR